MSQVRSSDITTAGWVLAALLALGACRSDGPDIAAAEPEPGDPSVYAPAEWPLRIGDRVSRGWRNGSHDEFPEWAGLEALHAIGDEVYSARYRRVHGALSGPLGDSRDYHYVYEGHFVQLATHPMLETAEEMLAPELRGRIRYGEPTPVEAAVMESARTGRQIGEIWGGDGWLRELKRSVAERVAERLAWERRAPLRDREDRREGTR